MDFGKQVVTESVTGCLPQWLSPRRREPVTLTAGRPGKDSQMMVASNLSYDLINSKLSRLSDLFRDASDDQATAASVALYAESLAEAESRWPTVAYTHDLRRRSVGGIRSIRYFLNESLDQQLSSGAATMIRHRGASACRDGEVRPDRNDCSDRVYDRRCAAVIAILDRCIAVLVDAGAGSIGRDDLDSAFGAACGFVSYL